jgi:type VI secretion system ImpC/EvpB family protein
LRHLVDQLEVSDDDRAEAIIRVLDVDWRRLCKDLEFASDYTHSQLFRQVYEDEFGSPGGKPFGLLLGDFEIGAGSEDMSTLRSISRIAASAFAPFVAQAHPSLMGLDHIHDLERQLDLHIRFESPEMRRWNELRDTEESRFVGLTIPRVLIRAPYLDDGSHDHGFRFAEDLSAADAGSYCWVGGIWALGGLAIRAFQESGWFADMRGIRRGQRGAGLVDGLIAPDHGTDAPGVACRAPLDVAITDEIEHELSGSGLICLCPNGESGDVAFYSIPSLSRTRKSSNEQASANAGVSAMLPHMLCVSRFAHALKAIARSNIGTMQDQATLRDGLNKWIRKYVIEGSSGSAEQRARYPLSDAQVELEPLGNSGNFSCILRLVPHLQFEAGTANVQLKTILEPTR